MDDPEEEDYEGGGFQGEEEDDDTIYECPGMLIIQEKKSLPVLLLKFCIYHRQNLHIKLVELFFLLHLFAGSFPQNYFLTTKTQLKTKKL